MTEIERDAYYGSLVYKEFGVEVVFNEAPWVVSEAEVQDPEELFLCAFHLHRSGHDGLAEYRGLLPHGVQYGDSKAEVIRKVGEPTQSGGGEANAMLGRIPIWVRYSMSGFVLHFQFDDSDRLEMVTVSTEEVQ